MKKLDTRLLFRPAVAKLYEWTVISFSLPLFLDTIEVRMAMQSVLSHFFASKKGRSWMDKLVDGVGERSCYGRFFDRVLLFCPPRRSNMAILLLLRRNYNGQKHSASTRRRVDLGVTGQFLVCLSESRRLRCHSTTVLSFSSLNRFHSYTHALISFHSKCPFQCLSLRTCC